MPKEVTITRYLCEECGQMFGNKKDTDACEQEDKMRKEQFRQKIEQLGLIEGNNALVYVVYRRNIFDGCIAEVDSVHIDKTKAESQVGYLTHGEFRGIIEPFALQ